jgi:hypothetical protein
VATAIALIGGLIGRWIVLAAAARTDEIRSTRALLDVAGFFERRMVQPGSLGILATGLLLAWLQHQPLLGLFEGSSANWLLVSLVLYLSSIPLVVLVFMPRGRHFAAVFEESFNQGQVTSELSAAFHDRSVFLSHVYEFFAVGLMLFLMVTKVI